MRTLGETRKNMQYKSSEQFDVLSNTLRVLPEEVLRLNYFIKKIDEAEEGISNIEVACVNVLNQIYGMMCSLKDDKKIESIYEYDAINTALCIRHVLQHQSGRIKNNLRDALKKQVNNKPVVFQYKDTTDFPFLVNINWLQESIKNSNNSKRLASINSYWNLDEIKNKIEAQSYSWDSTYMSIMAIITEAVRQIRVNYGEHFSPSGFDSGVYYDHFNSIPEVNTNKYEIIT